MYHCVIVKSFILTEEVWYRVGIYAEDKFAKSAQQVIEEAFPKCTCVIRQVIYPEQAKSLYPKELPAAALVPFSFQLLEQQYIFDRAAEATKAS